MKKLQVAVALILVTGGLWAQEVEASVAAQLQAVGESVDFVWVIAASALVFLMQAGFLGLESGLSRAKNSINVAVKNMADFVLALAGFWVIGFGIMFGASHNGWFGTTGFLIRLNEGSLQTVFFVFQGMFVATAATIDSGALAERTKFGHYLIISLSRLMSA